MIYPQTSLQASTSSNYWTIEYQQNNMLETTQRSNSFQNINSFEIQLGYTACTLSIPVNHSFSFSCMWEISYRFQAHTHFQAYHHPYHHLLQEILIKTPNQRCREWDRCKTCFAYMHAPKSSFTAVQLLFSYSCMILHKITLTIQYATNYQCQQVDF